MRRWSVHMCQLDRECRQYATKDFPLPWRINISTPRWWLGVALTPGSRFSRIDPVAWRERREKIALPSSWLEVHRNPEYRVSKNENDDLGGAE